MPEEQALQWKQELKDYTSKHRAVGGRPLSNPTFWLLYWTRPQVQARSHPEILKAMKAVMKLWHVDDISLPIDMESQVIYADRFRIRRAGLYCYTLIVVSGYTDSLLFRRQRVLPQSSPRLFGHRALGGSKVSLRLRSHL